MGVINAGGLLFLGDGRRGNLFLGMNQVRADLGWIFPVFIESITRENTWWK
jgi:hypothetical protein